MLKKIYLIFIAMLQYPLKLLAKKTCSQTDKMLGHGLNMLVKSFSDGSRGLFSIWCISLMSDFR